MVQNLLRAAGAIRHDPVGVLGPAGALLLLQVLGALFVRGAWHQDGLAGVGPAVLAALAIRIVFGAPFRAAMLVSGARALGLSPAPWGRWLALLGVQVLVAPLQIGAASLCLVAGGLATAFVAGHGWYTTASFFGFMGIAGATMAALCVRALFAYAPAEVVLGGRSAGGAMRASAAAGLSDGIAALALLVIGDLAVGLGALACGAGALPGYPLSDLALVDRFGSRGGGPAKT